MHGQLTSISDGIPDRGSEAVGDGQRPIGLATLVLLVVASMIGIGCFLSSGYALLSLGNPNRVIVAWVLCGVWALAGALAYGALARRVPLSGGEYVYLSRTMHPSIGFLAGWISLVAGFTAPIAAMAQAVVKYALPGIIDPHLASLAASIVIVVACALHATHIQLGARAQNAVVAIKLIFVFGLLIWAGLSWNRASAWQGMALDSRDSNALPGDWAGIIALLASMSWISLSYTGFNAAVYVAGESKSAMRNVPMAMYLATVLVTVLYVLLNAVFVWAPSPAAVRADPEAIAMLAMDSVGGPHMRNLLRIIVSLAVLSSVMGMLLAGPRVYAQMARDGVMPRWLEGQGGPPRWSLWLQAGMSIAIVWMASLASLIGYLGMTLSACSALAVAGLWFLSSPTWPPPPSWQPVRWWEHLVAAVYVLVTMAMLAAVVAEGQRRAELWAVAGTFALGLLLYILWQVASAPSADATGSKR